MITLRPSHERGHANHGWLDSHHTFSFADYYDPQQMGFRALRVINEDRVRGGHGFDTHPHRDFEIVSYIVRGELEHRDSMGHQAVMRAGDIQRISAGTGIAHSEYNHSPTDPVHFLQIWLTPSAVGLRPDYAEQSFAAAVAPPLTLACSPDGASGSIRIHQDASLLIGRLPPAGEAHYTLRDGRAAWVQMIDGTLDLNGQALAPGDGAAVERERELALRSGDGAHFLLFDLA